MYEQIPVPELAPEAVRATGAYGFATAICLLTFAVSFLIWRLVPLSRTLRAEARATCMASLVSLFILSTLLSAELIISMLNQHVGLPDWRAVLDDVPHVIKLGEYYLEFVRWGLMPLMASMAILGFLSWVFLPASFIITLIHGVFQYAGLLLAMVGVVAVLAMLLMRVVAVIALMAKHAYLLIAAGVAAFPVKWLRGLGISLIIFGLVMFYGLPAALGLASRLPAPALSEDELVKARLLDALNKESIPSNLYVSDAFGYPLPWSYVTMSSSVEYSYPSTLTNYTLPRGSAEIGWISEENLTVARHNFTYTRFYNGCYTWPFELSGYLYWDVFRAGVITWEASQGANPLALLRWTALTRTVLYRESRVEGLWFMGFELNATPSALSIDSGVDMERPDPALKNIKSAEGYYDHIYSRSPIAVIGAPAIDSLNRNSTAIVFYLDESYASVERLAKGDYLYRFNLSRTSYHCWLSREENVTDPETNQTIILKYYRAEAAYYGESPEDLYTAHLPALVSEPEAVVKSYRALDGGGYTPRLERGTASAGDLLSKKLIVGYGPLELERAYRIEEEFGGLGKSQVETAERSGYLPGKVVGEGGGLVTHVVEEPRRIVLDPNPTILYHRVVGQAHRQSGEEEGRCPSLPQYIPVEAEVEFRAEQSPAWDPTPLMLWEPMRMGGDKSYHLLYEEDPKHPQLEAPNMYRSPVEAGLGGIGLVPLVGEMIKWAFAIAIPLMIADAASAFLGGYSFAGTLLAAGKQVAGAFVGKMGLGVASFTRPRPSISSLLGKPRQLMEEQLLMQLQQEKLRAVKEGDKLKAAYATRAIARYAAARSAPSIAFARGEKKIGRLTIPWIKVTHPRAEMMSEFRKEASKLFPEQAAILEKLSDRVKLSRGEAARLLAKMGGEGLLGAAEADKLFRGLVIGRSKVPDVLRGDITLSKETRIALNNMSNPAFPLIWGMLLPPAAAGAARAAQARAFKGRASFSADMAFLNQKKVVGLDAGSGSEVEKPVESWIVRAHVEYDKGAGHVDVHNVGGRSLEFDLGDKPSAGDARSASWHEEAFRADAYLEAVKRYYYERSPPEDVEEPRIPYDADLARSVTEISKHTHAEGHDWWWEPGGVMPPSSVPDNMPEQSPHDEGLDYFLPGSSGADHVRRINDERR